MVSLAVADETMAVQKPINNKKVRKSELSGFFCSKGL
jgi:hypothetical protein